MKNYVRPFFLIILQSISISGAFAFVIPKGEVATTTTTTTTTTIEKKSISKTPDIPIENNNNIDRKKFLSQTILMTTASLLSPTSCVLLSSPKKANAFDGGVGGLGKTKPSTGVVFANPDIIDQSLSISTPGDYNSELLAPDGVTPAFLSFYAPWPMLKSSGIESRDLAQVESAFVQVVPNVEGKSVANLPKAFFINSIFAQNGKYGAYGTPTDIKVSKVRDDGATSIYQATFTTLTPAMRESDRKVYISAAAVGDGIFMLVTGTTVSRFKSQDTLLKKVAESFVCVEAPKSTLRRT